MEFLINDTHFVVGISAVGIDPESFRLAAVVDYGRALIGHDTSGSTHGPDVVRLIRLGIGLQGLDEGDVAIIILPFAREFQLAADPAGRNVLVLGEHGSRLILVDFGKQQVIPKKNGLELQRLGLRASGLAGYGPGFWLTAWQLDGNGAVVDERAWSLTPRGFVAGLSLDALRARFGQLRSFFLTGPSAGFFEVPAPDKTGEQLWYIHQGMPDKLVDSAESFGGMHAAGQAVAYTKRDGATSRFALWQTDGGPGILGEATEPASFFTYPLLAPDAAAAIVAQFSTATRSLTYLASATPAYPDVTPLLTTYPGQGKIARGVFAHYGPEGVELLPLPAATATSSPAGD